MSTNAAELLGKGDLHDAILSRIQVDKSTVTPPLPTKIAIEINNSCNHKCFFCPNPTMTRQRRIMKSEKVYKILDDARNSGIEEVSFYSTGEPFLTKALPDYVEYAKEAGFRYVFLSTNGGNVVSGKILPVLEAGLDSLKFSVNAGDRETYALVHGHDEFDAVMANIETAARYRKEKRWLRLFVSFVETEQSKHTFEPLKARLSSMVDEVVRYPFIVIGTPLKRRVESDGTERPYVGYEHVDRSIDLNEWRTTVPCYQLWSYLNVTAEGLLSACCSDFNNDLIVGNLNRSSLAEAWHSPEFQALRQRHLENRIGGTLCAGCVLQKNLPFRPINPHLSVDT